MGKATLKKSILVPIIFFSWFRFALTQRELRRYLWRTELSEEKLKEYLKELSQVNSANGLIWYGEVIGDRLVQQKLSDQLWQRVRAWRWLFSWVPFVAQVYISNTLAYDNTHTNSDIDLFIVAKTGRIWLARASLLLLLNFFHIRVRRTKRFAKFSPEFFVSEKALNLKPLAIEHDYYLSYWLADLVPIWPDGEHRKVRPANLWFKQDLPIAWRSPKLRKYRYLYLTWPRFLLEKILAGKWGDRLETEAYYWQRRIIERNIKRLGVNPSIVANRDIIKVHFNDRRAAVRDAVEATLDDLVGKNQ